MHTFIGWLVGWLIDNDMHPPTHQQTGYLNLAMIILGVHFSHACVDLLSALWSFGLKARSCDH